MANRRRVAVAAFTAGIAWLLIDLLLARIASGGWVEGWRYVATVQPWVFALTVVFIATGLALAPALVVRRDGRTFLASAIAGGLAAVGGGLLVAAGHDSGWSVGGLGLLAGVISLAGVRAAA